MKRADVLTMFGVGFQQNGIVPISKKDTILLFINRDVDDYPDKRFTDKKIDYCGSGKVGNQTIDWAYTNPILPEAKNAILAMAPLTTALLVFEVDMLGECAFLGNFTVGGYTFKPVGDRELVVFTLVRPGF